MTHLQERTRTEYEEKKKLAQTQAEIKAQGARYEDELQRKRVVHVHEAQRARNQELVRMQEESAIRLEQIRRNIEEEIQELKRRTEKEKAIIDQETVRLQKLAEAEANALQKKLSEDLDRRMLIEKANAEREKWVQAINATFEHIGGMPYQVCYFHMLILTKHVNFLELSTISYFCTFCVACFEQLDKPFQSYGFKLHLGQSTPDELTPSIPLSRNVCRSARIK